jgi:cation diffusion facilitator family transporter
MGTNETVTNKEKNRAALSSILAVGFLTLVKATVAILTGSLGLLAEAAHSLMDLVAAGVTFFAVKVSGRPADRSHTYGHGKVENLSALGEVLLLLAACAGIFYEAIQRLFFKSVSVKASIWSFLVMVVAIIVNIILARRLSHVAKKYDSQALEAEALDFRNDIWSSAVVILGLVVVMAADQFNIPWLAKADSIAGLAVATIVAISVLRLGRRAVGVLLDEVPENLQDEIRRAARLPGVEEVRQVRVRRSGAQYFADLTLATNTCLTYMKCRFRLKKFRLSWLLQQSYCRSNQKHCCLGPRHGEWERRMRVRRWLANYGFINVLRNWLVGWTIG